MAESDKLYSKNKILSLLQSDLGPSLDSSAKKDPEVSQDAESFTYPHFDRLNQILQKFKERSS